MRPSIDGDIERKRQLKMRPPMRSSVACTRCRKSKIKCENANGASPCDSCVKTGNECIFKIPDHVAPKRLEPPAFVKQERDGGPDRKRHRKLDDLPNGDSHKTALFVEDVLSASFLTEDLWEQILDLYKLHFAPELPFLHLPTMKEKLGRKKTSTPEQNSDNNIVLLGVLTLTARFHPDLVRYTAHMCNSETVNARIRRVQNPADPTAASEYYAEILAMALGPIRTSFSTASVDRVAALLMLGLYEWSQTQPKTGGMTAWMYVGSAIRMAQFLGLGFEDAAEAGDAKFRAADLRLKNAVCQSQRTLQKEIRRRLMFSCFILDRMLACGKHRVTIIRGEELDIQLPCSEDKFDLALEVRTGRLTHLESSAYGDSVLSRFIQMVNIWGEISKYSSRGGRVEDKQAPWHPESDFYKLNETLARFDLALPGTFTFSKSNYLKHENHQDASAYVLLHMLRFVCLIMLHREYVPFVPVRCRGPEGPLDKPTFTKEETPLGFWKMSAEKMFRAARGVVDLIEICQKKDKLPQSTIVLFAVWTTSFVGLYGAHFPQMDTEKHMLSSDYEDPWARDQRDDFMRDIFKRGPTALATHTLLRLATWQKMASTYVDILYDMNDYFTTIKQDYYKYSDKNGRPNNSTLRVREGGTGGGLEEYHPLVTKLKDFGTIQPDEHDVTDISERLRLRTLNRPSSALGSLSSTGRSATPASFTAINHSSILSISEMSRPLSRAATDRGLPQSQVDTYAESLRYHNTQQQQQVDLPPALAYPTPRSVLESGHTQTPVYESTMDDSESFWDKLQRDELRRFGATGDLSLFSTGQSELLVEEMPFGDSSYIPAMSGSSYQLLQPAEDGQV